MYYNINNQSAQEEEKPYIPLSFMKDLAKDQAERNVAYQTLKYRIEEVKRMRTMKN